MANCTKLRPEHLADLKIYKDSVILYYLFFFCVLAVLRSNLKAEVLKNLLPHFKIFLMIPSLYHVLGYTVLIDQI